MSSGRNQFVSLVAKSKLFFSWKFYLLPFEKIFFATFWVGFWAYLRRASPRCNVSFIEHSRSEDYVWGHRVVLFYILYFCYKKRRKAIIINKLHLNILFLSFLCEAEGTEDQIYKVGSSPVHPPCWRWQCRPWWWWRWHIRQPTSTMTMTWGMFTLPFGRFPNSYFGSFHHDFEVLFHIFLSNTARKNMQELMWMWIKFHFC